MDLATLYQIASDIEAGERDAKVLFGLRNLRPEQAKRLLESPLFRHVQRQIRDAVHSGDVEGYIRLAAKAGVGGLIKTMVTLATNEEIDPKARVAAAKLLTDIADIGPKPQTTVGSHSVSLTINLGDQPQVINAINQPEGLE